MASLISHSMGWSASQLTGLGIVTVCLTTFIFTAAISKRWNRRSTLPLPPGPKGLPLLGNLFDIPQKSVWLVYKEWGKQYGDIIYMEALGQRMIVLNSFKDVVALLEKRSSNYSDRAQLPALEVMGVDWTLTFMPYGSQWRANRRAFHQHLNQARIPDYHPIIQQETATFLRSLLDRPEAFMDELRSLFSHIIMRISYGVSDFKYNEQLIRDAEAIIDRMVDSVTPGRFMVNIFPALKWVPTWFPGAGWKRFLIKGIELSDLALGRPFRDAKERLANQDPDTTNEGVPSIVHRLLKNLPPKDDPLYPEMERVARDVSAAAFSAGSDTTVGGAHGLVLALAMHPDVQRKAREEIDAAIELQGNPGQLPDFKDLDLESLHYVRAVLKEVTRWHTVIPLGIPHMSVEEDEYNGYFIPKGTIFLTNTWAILHDPKVYESPLEFKPERFLKDGCLNTAVLDPDLAAFGYGRRICPGRYLSHDSLLYMTVALLSFFEIRPPKDEDPLKLEVTPEMLAKIIPYKCDIAPRSEKHTAFIRSLA